MSQSCFTQPDTISFESASPNGLLSNPAVASDRREAADAGSEYMGVVLQEHATPRTVSKRLNVTRVLQSWKDDRLTSIAEYVDQVCSSLSVRCCSHFILARSGKSVQPNIEKNNSRNYMLAFAIIAKSHYGSSRMTWRSVLCWNSERQRPKFVLHPASASRIFTVYFLRLISSANMQSRQKHKACVKN